MARWLESLNNFDFDVEHRPGQLDGNTDGLSRFPWDEGAWEKIARDYPDSVCEYGTLVEGK